MKGNTVISTITKIVLIVLITLISFVGIYVQKQNRMENVVKDYKYGMDLEGRRVISLKVSEEKETIIKDKDGNEVDEDLSDEQIAEKGYTKEEKADNKEELLTAENFEKSKNIIQKRLDKFGVKDYIIKLDKETGTIYLEIPEDSTTDHTVSNISEVGKFEIVDSENKNVLVNNSQLKSAKVLYNNDSTGTVVYLSMEFTKEGKEKLKEISTTYVETEEDKESDDKTNETDENTTSESDTETDEEEMEETTNKKQVTLQIDESEMITTSFDEPIQNGIIQLSMGSATTDKDKLKDTVQQASTIATLLDNGNLPIKYNVEENKYVVSDISQNVIQKIAIGIAIIVLIALVLLSIKFKAKGVLLSIAYIGFLAIFTLVIRYTNVLVTVNSMIATLIVMLLNYIFTAIILTKLDKQNLVNKAIKESYKEFFIKMVPVIVISIVFSFISWVPISSFGMTLMWGLVIMAIYNISITKSFLK